MNGLVSGIIDGFCPCSLSTSCTSLRGKTIVFNQVADFLGLHVGTVPG